MTRPRLAAAVASTALGLIAATTLATGPAGAAGPTSQRDGHVSEPIVSGLAGPLQIDAGRMGLYVSQSFAGLLTKVKKDGSTKDIVTEPGEIAGIAARGGNVAYTFTQYDESGEQLLAAEIRVRKPSGRTHTVADLLAFEEKRNPDGRQSYGFLDLDPACADQVPEYIGGYPYQGIIDAHPYALAHAPGGWYVADAAMNAVLKVTYDGRVSVVRVLKPQDVVITEEVAGLFGLPECTIGATYAFEAVPTDVEVSKSGHLFVTLLPGGPESPELGARGSVVKFHPHGYGTRTVATGFLGATNLALAPHGRIYVTELFGNKVSMIRGRKVSTVAELPLPAAVEYAWGKLFVTTEVFGDGKLVVVRP